MASVKFSARAFAAIGTLSAIGDGKLTKLEKKTAAQSAVDIAAKFNAAVEAAGVDAEVAKHAKRLLPRAIVAKDGDIEDGCRFAVKSAQGVIEEIDALEPAEPGTITEDDGTIV